MSWLIASFTSVGQGRLVLGGGVFGRILILREREDGSLRAMLSSELNSVPAVIALRMNGTLEALAAIFAIRRLKHIALPLSLEITDAELLEAQRITGVSYILNEHELRTSLQERNLQDW